QSPKTDRTTTSGNNRLGGGKQGSTRSDNVIYQQDALMRNDVGICQLKNAGNIIKSLHSALAGLCFAMQVSLQDLTVPGYRQGHRQAFCKIITLVITP